MTAKKKTKQTSRLIHCVMWSDETFVSLSPDAKLAFVYLLTSMFTMPCGVHDYNTRRIAHETGLDVNRVELAFAELEKYNRVRLSVTTGEILILNWLKWNVVSSRGSRRAISAENSAKNVIDEHFRSYIGKMLDGIGYESRVDGQERKKVDRRERVKTTDSEHRELLRRYNEEFVEKCYDKLQDYKSKSKRVYRSDYNAILNWVVEAVGKDERTSLTHTQKRNRDEIDIRELTSGAQDLANHLKANQ